MRTWSAPAAGSVINAITLPAANVTPTAAAGTPAAAAMSFCNAQASVVEGELVCSAVRARHVPCDRLVKYPCVYVG
jgi:hypothetical protein